MARRILVALASGPHVPNAHALAGAVVAPEKRGTELHRYAEHSIAVASQAVPDQRVLRHGFRMGYDLCRSTESISIIATAADPVRLDREWRTCTGLPWASQESDCGRPAKAGLLLALTRQVVGDTGAYTVLIPISPSSSRERNGTHTHAGAPVDVSCSSGGACSASPRP